jgi:hypothetical protein
MNEDRLRKAIDAAKKAAEIVADYKEETYLGVLISSLAEREVTGETKQEIAPASEGRPTASVKQFSPGELFAARGWKTDLDKVVLAGFYLEKYAAAQAFSMHDIKNTLVIGKVPVPKNLSLAIFKAARRAWVMEVPESKDGLKAWALTQSGVKRVEDLEK